MNLVWKGIILRIVTLLLCLALAACAGTNAGLETTPSSDPAATPAASPAADQTVPVPVPGNSPATPPAARRGAPQAARGASAPAVPEPEAELSLQDRIMQARVNCWAEVDKQRALRDIDSRIVWVDKCIADRTKVRAGR